MGVACTGFILFIFIIEHDQDWSLVNYSIINKQCNNLSPWNQVEANSDDSFLLSFYVHNSSETVLFMSTPDLSSVKYNQYLPPWKKDQMETNNGDISEIVLCWWVLRTGPRLSDSRTLSRIERCPIDCDRSLTGGRTYTGVTLSVLPPRQTTGKES